MQRSESIAAIAAALSKAQGQIQAAKKDSENPHFKAKYADLASIWLACRDALSANGIAVVQAPGECAEGRIWLTTELLHSSGEWLSEVLSIPLAKVDAHGLGSAITYGRRYALAAMVGVAPDDDDGNAAVAHGPVNNNERAGPVPRAKLDGAHTSKTALKNAIHALHAKVKAAEDNDAIDTVMREAKETIAQANRDWPELLTGDPNIAEDVGLRGLVEQRREAVSVDGSFTMFLESMHSNTSTQELAAWVAANEAYVEELSDLERRKFESALEAYEGGLALMATAKA